MGGFFEWTGPKGEREPHAIRLADDPVMLLAGLWVEHEGQRCYSVITTLAGDFMARLHDREPVVVQPKNAEEHLFSSEPPFHLIDATKDGELAEFACDKPAKNRAPTPVADSSL